MPTWTKNELNILENRDLTCEELHEFIPQHSLIAIRQACKTYNQPRRLKARQHGSLLCNDRIKELLKGEFLEIINGHLLGDGSIGKDGIRFSLSNSCYEYITLTQNILNKLAERKASINVDKRTVTQFGSIKSKRKPSYKAVCSLKQIFEPLRNKWYINGSGKSQKVIPSDMRLTPLTCNRWYIDDGSIRARTTSGIQSLELTLCTDDFLENDVDSLVEQLKNHNIHPRKRIIGKRTRDDNNKCQIFMYGSVVVDFLDFIGECPIEHYRYKWDIKTYQKRIYNCRQCSSTMAEWGFGTNPKKKFCTPTCSRTYFKKKYKENPLDRKPLSAETRRKISASLKGRQFSYEHRQNISAAKKGKK